MELSTNQKGAIAETAITAAAVQLGIDRLPPGHRRRSLRPDARHRRAVAPNAVQMGEPGGRRRRRARPHLSPHAAGLRVRNVLPRRGRRRRGLVPGYRGARTSSRSPRSRAARASICASAPARNNQEQLVHWAADYRLGAIAQLGERATGSQRSGVRIPLAPPHEVGRGRTAAGTQHSSLTVGCLAHESAGARPATRTIVDYPPATCAPIVLRTAIADVPTRHREPGSRDGGRVRLQVRLAGRARHRSRARGRRDRSNGPTTLAVA